MTTREYFLAVMFERRTWPRTSDEYDTLSREARKLVWIMRGVPSVCWDALEQIEEKKHAI